MRSSSQSPPELAPELQAVLEAGEAGLRARAGEDESTIAAAAHRLQVAVGAALASGHSLSAVAAASRRGEERARRELAARVLGQVRRTAERRRESELAHEKAIALADRLGLSHRDIATAAGMATGTVRAMASRVAGRDDQARTAGPNGRSDDGAQLASAAPKADCGEEARDE